MNGKKIIIIATAVVLLLTVTGLAWRFSRVAEEHKKPATVTAEKTGKEKAMKEKAAKEKAEKEKAEKEKAEKEKVEKEKAEKEKAEKEKAEKEAAEREAAEKENVEKEVTANVTSTAEETSNPPASSVDIPPADSSGYNGTYRIDVNRAANTVTVYQRDENGNFTVPVKAMVCSTGPVTPLGDYYLPGRKQEIGLLFGDVYGIYATDIVGHILFHSVPARDADPNTIIGEEYNKLGTSASAGCVRLTVPDAHWIQSNAATGTWVHIYDDANNPGPLGKPVPMRMNEAYGPDPSLQ